VPTVSSRRHLDISHKHWLRKIWVLGVVDGHATEELSHLEIVGSIVVMLNKGAKGIMAEGVEEEGELYRAINGAGKDSHFTTHYRTG
jgi:Mn-containing catalase